MREHSTRAVEHSVDRNDDDYQENNGGACVRAFGDNRTTGIYPFNFDISMIINSTVGTSTNENKTSLLFL